MTDVLRILIALLLWLVVFSIAYGLHGIGCAADWASVDEYGASVFRLVLVAVWGLAILAHLALLKAMLSPRFGSSSCFVSRVSIALAIAALAATAWTLFPVAFLSRCI